MVLINKAINEMTLKVVYYGPGLCGKTTNLQFIHNKSNPNRRGKLLSIATETDRTLFFDLLPIELGTVRGMKVRVQLYTVPGQVFYDATRRLVLRGADGVVFVADSQKAMMDANIESMKNLQENFIKNNLDPKKIPLVLQFNKRDLPNVASCEDLNNALRYRLDTPYFEASAVEGFGVNETLKAIVSVVVKNVNSGASHELEPGAKVSVELGPGMKKAAQAAAPVEAPRPAKKAPEPVPEPVGDELTEVPDDLSDVDDPEAAFAEPLEEAPEDIPQSAPAPVLAEEIDSSDRDEYLRSLLESNRRLVALSEETLNTLKQQQAVLEKLLRS
jgi:mutual gliding-motility protein MglA